MFLLNVSTMLQLATQRLTASVIERGQVQYYLNEYLKLFLFTKNV